MDPHARVKLRIYVFAVLLLAALVALRFIGVDRELLKILAIAAALLVGLLLITYRAFAGVAESARSGQLGPMPPDDEDER